MTYWQPICAALLAGFASLLVPSLARAYQQNFTCQGGPQACAPGQTYQPIRWEHDCVDYYLDRAGSRDFEEPGVSGASQALEEIVKRSFETWSEPVCSGISLHYRGLIAPDAEPQYLPRNIVSFKPAPSHTSAAVFASTYVSYNPSTGIISDADIYLNSEFHEFSNDPSPGPGKADLQNTLTHEVGHLLGFGHSAVIEATMFGGAVLGETHKRSLHQDDIALLCTSYPLNGVDPACGILDSDAPAPPIEWPTHPGPTDEDIGTDPTHTGCNVTRAPGSATLSPWFVVFGLLLAGWTRGKFRNWLDRVG